MTMIAFPATLPTDAVLVVLDRLRGRPVEPRLLWQAGWNLIGFGLHHVVPGKPAARTDHIALATVEHELAILAQGGMPSLSWEMLVTILIELLRQWLTSNTQTTTTP